jgi:hypothetical protein
LIKTLPNTSVFMSSLTIMLVAFDRFWVICRPTSYQASCFARLGLFIFV